MVYSLLKIKFPGLASIITNGFWQAFMVGYLFIIRVIFVLALSHLLGPEGYGFFAYSQAYYLAFLPLVLLGLDAILPREIGKTGKNSTEIINRTFSIRLSLGILLCAVAIGFGVFLEASPQHQLIIALISLALIPRSFQSWAGAVFEGFEKSYIQARFAMGYRTAEVLIGILLLYLFNASLLLLVVSHIAIWAAYAVSCTRYINRHLIPISFRFKLADFKDLLGENFYLTLQMMASYLLVNTVLLLFRHTSGSLDVYGQFALAFQAVSLAVAFIAAFNAASSPVLARSHQRKDNKDRLYAVGLSLLFLVAGLVSIALLQWLGRPLVLLMLGETYQITAELIAPMAWWMPCLLASYPLGQYFIIRKRIKPIICSYLAGWGALLGVLATADDLASSKTMIHAITIGSMVLYIVISVLFLQYCQTEKSVGKSPHVV